MGFTKDCSQNCPTVLKARCSLYESLSEHTPTPLAELDAAAMVLQDDGVLFIEI